VFILFAIVTPVYSHVEFVAVGRVIGMAARRSHLRARAIDFRGRAADNDDNIGKERRSTFNLILMHSRACE